jgi:hypothetical protein
MVYAGRYKQGRGIKNRQILGGKKFLFLLALFVCLEVLVECFSEMIG